MSSPATPDDGGENDRHAHYALWLRATVDQFEGEANVATVLGFAQRGAIKAAAALYESLAASPPPEPPAVLDMQELRAFVQGVIARDRYRVQYDEHLTREVRSGLDSWIARGTALLAVLSRPDRDGEPRVPRPHAELDDTTLVNTVTPDMLLGLEEVCGFGLADYPDLRTALCDAYNRAASPGGTDG